MKKLPSILQEKSPCTKITPRSLRFNSSAISTEHDLVKAGIAIGRSTYGSPTLSDQAVLSCQSLKLGPGDSTRSHSADEFIYLSEIEEGIQIYIKLIKQMHVSVISNLIDQDELSITQLNKHNMKLWDKGFTIDKQIELVHRRERPRN